MKNFRFLGAVALASVSLSFSVQAAQMGDYLIIGQYLNDTAVDVSNYELGRVSALADSAPAVSDPGVAPSVSDTPTYDGNVAIVKSSGTVKTSDVNVYADRGIDCAGSYNSCTDTGSNLSNSQYDNAAGGTGLRTLGPNPDGVNGGVDMSGLIAELNTAEAYINALGAGDITDSIATVSGDILGNTVVNLASGLNILDFSGTGGADITVKANLIFQGGADAFAIVLVNDDALFKTSQGNLLIGDDGIGLNNVVIVSRTSGTGANIDLSNTIINGVALWDIGSGAGNVSMDNVTGCTQVVGDDVDIQNVRLSRCAFDTSVVPIPAAAPLFASALLGLGWLRRRNLFVRRHAG